MTNLYTKQEIFDKVWDWFVVQGNPRSINELGQCFYRRDDGAKCAVGILIPDEAYIPSWDTTNVSATNLPWVIDNFDTETVGFLQHLQSAHDSTGASIPNIRERFLAVASSHGLTVPSEPTA